jgi:lysine 2,3-aminomutase
MKEKNPYLLGPLEEKLQASKKIERVGSELPQPDFQKPEPEENRPRAFPVIRRRKSRRPVSAGADYLAQRTSRLDYEKLNLANPKLWHILKNSASIGHARSLLYAYLHRTEVHLYEDRESHPLEMANSRECINVFKNLLSPRNEEATDSSALNYLWMLAKGKVHEIEGSLKQGFIEEFYYLFKGVLGNSGIYSEPDQPKSHGMKGRRAAKARSAELDELSRTANSYIERYKHGLMEEVVARRAGHKERILGHFGASGEEWNDWRWHLTHVIKDAENATRLLSLSDEEREAIRKGVKAGIPFGITPYYLSLIDEERGSGDDHSLRAQVLPTPEYAEDFQKNKKDWKQTCDFMQEKDTSPINLVTRRYPMIAIFKLYNSCSQICMYCQRNWEIQGVLSEKAQASAEDIERALDWFNEKKELREVLITGGDPLVMEDDIIERVMKRFAQMEHIERIRIGTRTPVVLPQRITDRLADLLAGNLDWGKREVSIVTHFQHPYEITPESRDAICKLQLKGISVYNQQVFTMENSRLFESMALRRLLKLIGIEPYYTFNTKGKEEMNHFRVPIARLLQERREEVRLFSGMLRTDEPVFNLPRLGKNYIRTWQNHDMIMILPDGRRVYEFHPWEKNIAMVDTFTYTDVSIYDYLRELARRGENLSEYRTIWYYY